MERITTALHTASHFGQIFKIDSIIEEGISINAKDFKGCTPLHLAITGCEMQRCQECSRSFPNHCKPFCNLPTSLPISSGPVARFNPLDIHRTRLIPWRVKDAIEVTVAKLLGIRGCQVNAQDDTGQTPLHWAAGRGHIPVIMLLLKNGADINKEDNEGRTALNNAIRECEPEAVEILLKEGGFYPESMFTAITAEDCDVEIMKLLLPFYYDVDSVRNKGGETFLHVAVSSLYADVPEVLLEAEASVNVKCVLLQETPLHKALKCLHFRQDGTTLIASLLKRLPDITVKNVIGQSPVELSLDLPEYQELLTKHTCKLLAADLFKSWHLCVPTDILYYQGQTKFYESCLEELKYMKETVVEDVSLYSLLKKSPASLLRLLRNKNLRDKLTDEYLEQCYSQIPVYKDILENKLKHALRRADLIASCQIFFSCLNLPLVPPHCIDAILSYLTRQELVLLSKVCQGLS